MDINCVKKALNFIEKNRKEICSELDLPAFIVFISAAIEEWCAENGFNATQLSSTIAKVIDLSSDKPIKGE